MATSGRTSRTGTAFIAIAIAAVFHLLVVWVVENQTLESLLSDALALWTAIGVWALAILLVLLSVIRSTRGLFLLGGEAWRRVALAALAAIVGGVLGYFAGGLLQDWMAPMLGQCVAGSDVPQFCGPGELLQEMIPWASMVGLAGLAWTVAASRR